MATTLQDKFNETNLNEQHNQMILNRIFDHLLTRNFQVLLANTVLPKKTPAHKLTLNAYVFFSLEVFVDFVFVDSVFVFMKFES